MFILDGGYCLRLSVHGMGTLVVDLSEEFQGRHEEADTLLVFHAKQIRGNIVVRSSDSDVLILMLGLSKKIMLTSNILMGCGTGNNRRKIKVKWLITKARGAPWPL